MSHFLLVDRTRPAWRRSRVGSWVRAPRPARIPRSGTAPAALLRWDPRVMAPVGHAELSAGRAALDRGDWAAARSVFAELVRREDDPDAHYGLARALEWEGSYGAAVRCYERAYSGY